MVRLISKDDKTFQSWPKIYESRNWA